MRHLPILLVAALALLAPPAARAQVLGPAGAPEVAGSAAADTLRVNPEGIGHMLLLPYFTAQQGHATLIDLINTDVYNGKAVKLRFRGADHGDTLLDFTLLLAPGDMWTAGIVQDATSGLARLVSVDRTCTLPAAVAALPGRLFGTGRLGHGAGEEHATLDGATRAARTREGMVEILTLADIPPQPFATSSVSLFQDIRHIGGTPPGCTSERVNALLGELTDHAAAQALGLAVPTTGLAANWIVINVPLASSHTGEATAIEARVAATGRAGYGNLVLFPQTSAALDLERVRRYTADPLLRGGVADNRTAAGTPGAPALQATMADLPDLSTPYLNADLARLDHGVATRRQASRLGSELAVRSIDNEYVTTAELLAVTDWTIAMPTRRYSVARDYRVAPGSSRGTTVFTNLARDDAAAPSGSVDGALNWFTPANTVSPDGSASCTVLRPHGLPPARDASASSRHGAVTADRDARFADDVTPQFPPAATPAAEQPFCGAVAVSSFNAPIPSPSVLGGTRTRRDLVSFLVDGWWRIATPGLDGVADAAGPTGTGLPILGGAFLRFTNLAVSPGVSGNYGTYVPHRGTRE